MEKHKFSIGYLFIGYLIAKIKLGLTMFCKISLARCDRHCLKRTCREAVGLLFWTGKPCSLAQVRSEHEQHQVFDACLVCSSGRVYPLKFPGEEGKGFRLRLRPN